MNDYQRVLCSKSCGRYILVPTDAELSQTKGFVRHTGGRYVHIHERVAYKHELASLKWTGKAWAITPDDFVVTKRDRIFL